MQSLIKLIDSANVSKILQKNDLNDRHTPSKTVKFYDLHTFGRYAKIKYLEFVQAIASYFIIRHQNGSEYDNQIKKKTKKISVLETVIIAHQRRVSLYGQKNYTIGANT